LGKLRIITWSRAEQKLKRFPHFTGPEYFKWKVTLKEIINRVINNDLKPTKKTKPQNENPLKNPFSK